ncbi:MAG: TonB-dependent receptor [Alphaproteobacteria bacterium]|nr:TonB-dependent receptor [Alphaproteobacteria bacterium]
MIWVTLALAQQLPVLEEAAPPRYPAEALASGQPAAVVLRLTVDDTGAVRRAEVEEGVDPAFDRAALDAARATRFRPALDEDGEPAWAEILYEVRFEPDLAPVLSVEGTVRQAGTRQPAADVRLRAEGPDGSVRYATIDPDGRFGLVGLAPGPWTLTVESPGYDELQRTVEVTPGKVVGLDFSVRLVRPWEVVDDDVDEVIVVEEEEAAVEVSERVLTMEDIRYLPGTGGDIVKAVQNLPGVSRPPLGIGQLLIRGTAPEDSAYYLDGARLPTVFHFSGLSTVLNGDSLADVALLSGNYSTRYGRTLGGVVDLRVDTDLPERSRGYVSVDLLQTTAFVEQKIGPDTSLTVSGRRSYIDAVLSPVLSAAGGSTVRAPRYYDLQTRLLHRTDQGTLDLMFLLSDDSFRVLGDAEDPDAVQIGLTDRFQKLRMRWTHDIGAGWDAEVSFLIGPSSRSFDLAPDGRAIERDMTVNNRWELTRGYRGGWHAWRMGVDVYTGASTFSYDIEAFGVAEKGGVGFMSPSPYVEPSVKLGPVELTGGVRVDPWILDQGYSTVAVDPRLVGRVDATPTTRFEAAVGQFSQFPGVRQVLPSQQGNPDLGPSRSLQASVGLEQDVGPVGLEVTVFGSMLSNLVVGREDAFRFFTGPPPSGPLDTGPYANDGTGRVGGVEMLARLQTERTLGWLSATFSRSTRVNRPGDKEALFIYDQPVTLTALASHELPRGWRIGGRARYGSGNPYNPVVNRIWDADSRSFRPVYDPDTSRLPAFFALDLRVDKEFTFERWKLTTYLDVQNATNRNNPEVMGWTDDYEREEPISGLPVVPAFGLRGEW